MKTYLKHGMIKSKDLVPKDLDNAKDILGKPDGPLKGKTTAATMTRDKSQQVMLQDIPELKERMVKLYIDIFYVNGIIFLHTKSKNLNYITIQKLDRRTTSEIKKKLKYVIMKYLSRGITITDVFADNEFNQDAFREMLLPATLHICAKGEHVPIIERSVRTVKERARSVCNVVPYTKMTRLMVISLLEGVERWLNIFPNTSGDEPAPSPAMVIEGREYPSSDQKRIAFGKYAMVHVGTKNDMSSRT